MKDAIKVPVICSYLWHKITPTLYEIATKNLTTFPPDPTLLPFAVQYWWRPDFVQYILPVGARP